MTKREWGEEGKETRTDKKDDGRLMLYVSPVSSNVTS